MKKNDLKKIIVIGAAAAAAAGAAYVVYKKYKKKADKERHMQKLAGLNAYILGGGLSAYASALYLIRDCGLNAENVHVFAGKPPVRQNAEEGFVCRRNKLIDEKKSKNLFDLMRDVRSLDIPDLTVLDEILNIYSARNDMRGVTFIDDDCNVIDISKIRLDKTYRRIIVDLLREKKSKLIKTSVKDIMPSDFFGTHFWKLLSAAYGFGENSGAYEFVNAIAHFDDTLSGTMPSDFDRDEEITEPLKAHLKTLGADVAEGAVVSDIDFENGAADAVHYLDNGVRKTVYMNENDICIFPTDEMAESASYGSFNEAAPKDFSSPYMLWERLAEKHPSFKNPKLLFEDDDTLMSQEFTITLSNRLLPELIDSVTSGALGQDGVIVLDNSEWKMTICAVPQTHFKDTNEDTAIIWGTASGFENEGAKSGKAMTDCSGAEILYELICCLNLEEAWDDIRETVVNVIPCHRRYDKAYIAPVESKLEIIPTGISNFAVSGDFADGDGSVFTEEYTVSTARKAAYRLADKKKRVYQPAKITLGGIKRILKKKF